jgi:hypothetical protein
MKFVINTNPISKAMAVQLGQANLEVSELVGDATEDWRSWQKSEHITANSISDFERAKENDIARKYLKLRDTKTQIDVCQFLTTFL